MSAPLNVENIYKNLPLINIYLADNNIDRAKKEINRLIKNIFPKRNKEIS